MSALPLRSSFGLPPMPHKRSRWPGKSAQKRAVRRVLRHAVALPAPPTGSPAPSSRNTLSIEFLQSTAAQLLRASRSSLPFTDGSADFGRCVSLPALPTDLSSFPYSDPLLRHLASLPAVRQLSSVVGNITGSPDENQQHSLAQAAQAAKSVTTAYLEDLFSVHKDQADIADLHSTLLRAFIDYAGGEDATFAAEVARHGAPLGLDPTYPIPSSHGLFPLNLSPSSELPGVSPSCSTDLLTNYSSVELQSSLVSRMYTFEEARGWMERVPPGDEFRQVKVALILKKAGQDHPDSLPDESLSKHYRLIEDYRRNHTNTFVDCPET
ncbi:hypothetical protein FOL47_002731, partial [Perkinsus chesapeaki]